jgi:hypothetical protein
MSQHDEVAVKLWKISFKSQHASTFLVAMVTVMVVDGLSMSKVLTIWRLFNILLGFWFGLNNSVLSVFA